MFRRMQDHEMNEIMFFFFHFIFIYWEDDFEKSIRPMI